MTQGSFDAEYSGDNLLFDLPNAVAAAHELKTPLALIRQLSQSIKNDDLPPEQIDKLSSRILLTSERALRLANDLTRAERLDQSSFLLEPVSASGVCEEAIDELNPLYKARCRTLDLKTSRFTPPVIANRDLLRRVITNLADNALNYGGDSPITVTTKYNRRDNSVRIVVRDFGPSVPIDVWRSIRQAEKYPQSISIRPESSGLGLYLAQKFAQFMGAKLGVVRHRDGASFFVELKGSSQLSWL